MKTTICSFAELVAQDYGQEVATAFRDKFVDTSKEIGFQQAMNILSGVLQVLTPAKLPRTLIATDSLQQKRTLKYAD